MNTNQKNIESAFYSDGYKLGMNVAVSDNNQEVLFESISEMYASIDSLIESLTEFAEKQDKRIDCKIRLRMVLSSTGFCAKLRIGIYKRFYQSQL